MRVLDGLVERAKAFNVDLEEVEKVSRGDE